MSAAAGPPAADRLLELVAGLCDLVGQDWHAASEITVTAGVPMTVTVTTVRRSPDRCLITKTYEIEERPSDQQRERQARPGGRARR